MAAYVADPDPAATPTPLATTQPDPGNTPVTSTSAPTPNATTNGGRPDGDNGPGQGYGNIYNCGNSRCAKTERSYATQCVIVEGPNSNTNPAVGQLVCPDGDNGKGQGYGGIYACGMYKCATTDKTYAVQCTIVAPCPDGDNGAGKGFGGIYRCGDHQCAKTDKSYAKMCQVVGS